MQPAGGKKQEQAGEGAAHYATMFTMRSGTTDHFTRRSPVQQALYLVRNEREQIGRGAVQASRGGERIAQLAVDLHGEITPIFDEQRRIEARPRRVGDHSRLSQQRPAFLAEVRRHRRD